MGHWGAYCLIGSADIISPHCVKKQGVASGEWSISSIDALQIWEAIGPGSYELYYFGQGEEWMNWVMLWDFKPNIYFLYRHNLEFGV